MRTTRLLHGRQLGWLQTFLPVVAGPELKSHETQPLAE